VLQFWYRQSPHPLVSTQVTGRVYSTIPPLVESGMAGAKFDMQGRLRHFYAVTPQVEPPDRTATVETAPDWSLLFAQARLDPALFRPATPSWTPPFYCDARAAWEGTYPERPDIPIRIEAAAYRGRPVFFQIVAPWTRPDRMSAFQPTPAKRAAAIIGSTLVVALLAASAFLARRHLVAGKGDQTGAFRLAAYTVISGLVAWLLFADHVSDLAAEAKLAGRALGAVLVLALLVWVLYLALEPYVRRLWPHALISWTRLLGGRIIDARVGSDVLIGIATAGATAVAMALCFHLLPLVGQPAPRPSPYGFDALLGVREVAAVMILGEVNAAALGMSLVLMILLLRLAVPEWLAVALVLVIASFPDALGSDLSLGVGLLVGIATLAVPTLILLRFGLLAAITNIYVLNVLASLPLTPDLGSWMGGPTVVLVLVLGSLLALSFHAATVRRPGVGEAG
jgi:serine/threonine-protein kinase